jgi:hypothetical protein
MRVLSTPADLPRRGSAADQYEERADGSHQRGPIRRIRALFARGRVPSASSPAPRVTAPVCNGSIMVRRPT